MSNDYYLYRRKIKSGDLLAWDSGSGSIFNTITLFIIKVVTLSPYVHVGVAWKTAGRLFVIEAGLDGVKISPLSKKKNFYHIAMDVKWTTAHDCFLLNKVGESYSVSDAIRGALGLLESHYDHKWQCAELATAFYSYLGMDLGDSYTPAKLVDVLLTMGKTLVKVTRVDKPRS